MDLNGKRVLVTGATGQVGSAVVRRLAGTCDLWGAARFSKAGSREKLEAHGVHTAAIDLASDDLADLPSDFDIVLNFAVTKSADADFDADIAGNAEGVGHLMRHCASADAFLHCSSTAVYESAGRSPRKEIDPLGDDHRVFQPTYSISKIAAEAVARFGAKAFGVPTVIARLCVPYGDFLGWPFFHLMMVDKSYPVALHTDRPNVFNLIHLDDIMRTIPALLDAASVPATIINWAGDEQVSIEDWTAFMGQRLGKEPILDYVENALDSVVVDTSKLQSLAGPSTVHWTDGLSQMIDAQQRAARARDHA